MSDTYLTHIYIFTIVTINFLFTDFKTFNYLQNQQSEIDLLNERGRDITRQADHENREHIEKQLSNINKEWTDLVNGLESRRDTLTKLAQHWEVSTIYT